MTHDKHSFVFRGLLCGALIRDLEDDGALARRDASDTEREHVDALASVSGAIRSRARYMQRAYFVLHVFENVVREFIESTFIEVDQATDWFDARGSRKMKDKVQQRMESESNHQWHHGRQRSPIFFLDFGDLSDLITGHWDVFCDLLPNQAWVVSRIGDAERSRNVIAHTNLLEAEEVQRLEQHLKDWIRQLG